MYFSLRWRYLYSNRIDVLFLKLKEVLKEIKRKQLNTIEIFAVYKIESTEKMVLKPLVLYVKKDN